MPKTVLVQPEVLSHGDAFWQKMENGTWDGTWSWLAVRLFASSTKLEEPLASTCPELPHREGAFCIQ